MSKDNLKQAGRDPKDVGPIDPKIGYGVDPVPIKVGYDVDPIIPKVGYDVDPIGPKVGYGADGGDAKADPEVEGKKK